MKKSLIFILIISCVMLLSACAKAETENNIVLSFCGKNETLELNNGVIVLSDSREAFSGGNFEVVNPEIFSNISSYSITFYTTYGDKKSVIISDGILDKTENVVEVGGGLGQAAAEDVLLDYSIKNVRDLKDNLWFELKTMDVDGNENTHQLQLDFTQVTQIDIP